MKWIIGLLALCCLVAGFGFYRVRSGALDVAADQPPRRFEERFLRQVREASIDRRAGDLSAPAGLDDPARAERAGRFYATHCAVCHGAPGVAPHPLAVGLHPVPPNLDQPRVQDRSDAELFWITKNGLLYTGMPAFRAAADDGLLWATVAFVRRLPDLAPGDYRAIADRAVGEPAGSGAPSFSSPR